MSNKSLKENIGSVHGPQFQLAYIHNTTNPSHENLVKFYCDVHYIWWWNQ